MRRSDTLFFQTNDDYAGSVRVLATVIEQNYSNQNITVIASSGSNGFLSELPNVRVIHYWNPRWKGLCLSKLNSVIWRICAYTLTFFFGLFHKTFYINTIVPVHAARIGKLLHKEIIYHVHEKFVVSTPGTDAAEFVFNKTKAHRIFVSNYLKNQYPENTLCTSEVLYNKLSKSFLRTVVETPLEERNRNHVIMIATLMEVKGAYRILEIAKSLNDIRFTFIANASAESIKSFYEGYELPKNLTIHSRQSNIQPFLQESDLLINITDPKGWVETFGMTILEAMAFGIPSIVPNAGGPLEIIEDGVNGYCVDVTNTDVIKDKILYILNEDNYAHFVEGAKLKFNELQNQ